MDSPESAGITKGLEIRGSEACWLVFFMLEHRRGP
jgi:hypothetical protein